VCACLVVIASARLVPATAWAAGGLHLTGVKGSNLKQTRGNWAMSMTAKTEQLGPLSLALPPVVLGTFQLKGDEVKSIVRTGLEQVIHHSREWRRWAGREL
jgi:hypothetical protein